ncbi:extracellular solute-binding protein [Geminicoccus roseus]|uniref:extracellular solute-binding protein n=1 Tax=Geminicoccus roseus TaxID=404900 RepID=UPI00054F15F7|nr:extracellular solute-binding protein [Geminicoccus roseus]
MKRRDLLSVAAAAALLSTTSFSAFADDAFWAKAAEPYQGVTIRGVSESTPSSNWAKDVIAKEFTEKTGIEIQFETTSWDQMYDKAIKDMEAGSGIYDFVYIEQDIIYSYLSRDFLVNITQALKDNPDLAAPNFDTSAFTTFADYFKGKDGDLYGVPMEAFLKTYLYRTDLFSDPDIKAQFKEKYGRDLAPATDHQQYREIAEFFTEYGQENDLQLWGTTVQASSGHPASFYEFVETIAPTFGVYNWGLNTENWAATVENGGTMNSDKAKAALSWWIGNLQYAPPESTSSTWDEVAASFSAGRAAQAFVYGENTAWIATDENKSTVVGNVGVALPPVEPGVMEEIEAGEGYIGYYDGGAFGIPHSSKNKEAALLFLQYVGQPEVQVDWAVNAARVTHTATYEDPRIQEQDEKTSGYYSLMRDEGKLFAGAPDFPFHGQLREAIAPFFYDAITGKLTPEEALDQAAARAEEELTRLGYRKS